MTISRKTALFITLLAGIAVQAQQLKPPADPGNAALLYLRAFEEIKNPRDNAVAELMWPTISGAAPWNEEKLGPIVDQYREAILLMQQAASLPQCNWGVKDNHALIESRDFMLKTDFLVRLNTLYGERLLARGESDEAVATWLKGLKFAQHLDRGVEPIDTMIAAQVAKMSLLHLTKAVENGKVSGASLEEIKTTLEPLPPDVLQWTSALEHHTAATKLWLEQGLPDVDQKMRMEALGEFMMNPSPGASPSSEDIAQYSDMMNVVIEAFRLPPDQTEARLQHILGELKHPVVSCIPNLIGINGGRKQLVEQRQALLAAMARVKT
jgi:hypothetical protein